MVAKGSNLQNQVGYICAPDQQRHNAAVHRDQCRLDASDTPTLCLVNATAQHTRKLHNAFAPTHCKSITLRSLDCADALALPLYSSSSELS